MAAFVLFEYFYRLGAKVLLGSPVTAFTPSRFLTDAVYPLAFAAGWTLNSIADVLGRVQIGGKALTAVGALVLIAVVGGQTAQRQCFVVIKPDEMAMLRWTANNTPPSAMILWNPIWLEYVTWREGSHTPLPVSEPVNDPSVVYKRDVLAARDVSEIAKWHRATGREVYLVNKYEEISQPEWTLIFRNGQWQIYRFTGVGAK
jgi:hypothetical protein